MYTSQEIALKIEQHKPDFTEFKELLQKHKLKLLLNNIKYTNNIYEKLFKAQLTLITYYTHNQFYMSKNISEYLDTLVFENISEIYNYNVVHYIKDSFNSYQIAYYIKNIKPYLTPYLWNKIRLKNNQTICFKKLKPNKFALTVFKKYLESLKKKLPSTQIEVYIKQIKNFPIDIKQEYLEILLSHTEIPSWSLQNELKYSITTIKSKNIKKFMSLGNKCYISSLAAYKCIPVPFSVHDNRTSDYKPFITNVKRKPTTDLLNLSFLVGISILLKTLSKQQPNPVYDYFAECVDKHLKEPEYEKPLKKYLQTLKINKEILKGYFYE